MSTDIYSQYKMTVKTFNPLFINKFGAINGLFLSSLMSYQYGHKLYNDNFFEYLSVEVEKQTGLSKELQLSALNDLLSIGLLETKYEGIPVKCFIRLKESQLYEIFESTESSTPNTKIANIKQFKQLGIKQRTTTRGKNKFQQFYTMATERFSDKDLLDLLYKYLQEKIGQLSHGQWEICLKHLEEYGLQYSPVTRKAGMLLMVEKAIAGGWFDFYKLTDYQLQQLGTTGYNKFGEPINNNKTDGDKDEWGKNCNFDIAVDENGNPIKF